MPGQYFMGVDKRYDHSMRIPRPDLSIELSTPNACTQCHDDKTDQWALGFVNKWYGERKKAHYATLIADAYAGKAGADSGLLRIINSNLYPEIIRATAINYLSTYQSQQAQDVLRITLNDPDPLLRYTAVENYWTGDSTVLFSVLSPLLNDPVKSVRMQSANRLATYPKSAFNEIQYPLFVRALDEYRESQEYVADFPTGRYNLGNFYAKTNNPIKAEENYREALAIDKLFYPAKTNLSLIYYRHGNTADAENLLLDMVSNHPDVLDGYYYLALLYAEQNKSNEAIKLLETASEKPGVYPRLFYNLGLLYQMNGQNVECESALLNGLDLDPCNFDLLYALFAFHMNQDQREKAGPYVERMRTCFPDEKQVQDLYNDFVSKN